ncbi:MAG: hypothetical protein U0798_02620 [Gemmataceae bacterium]
MNRPLWDDPSRSKWFGGGCDTPGMHSIAVGQDETLRVGVSTAGVWRSDGSPGRPWRLTAKGMHADYMPRI